MMRNEERKESFNSQIRKTEIKKDAQIIQKELAKELKAITKPDDTAENMNQALDDVVAEKEEKLRQLKMGDAILRYIQSAEAQQRKMSEMLEQTARANAELLRLNEERASSVLSAEQMRSLLRQEIPRIKVENHYTDLLVEVDEILVTVTKESDKLKSEVTQMLLNQANAQSEKNNLLIILLVASIILQFIF